MKVEILGVKVDKINLSGTIAAISGWLNDSGQNLIATINPEFILAAQQNPAFRKALNHAALATADGFGLIMAGIVLKRERLIRVTGADLSRKLLKGACPGAEIYLLGGAEGAAPAVKEKYAGERIVGAESGGKILEDKWELADNEAVVERINNSGANLLLVAFGQVKQEMWIGANLAKLPGIRVAIGVGGTLDYLSGRIKRAPAGFRALGLEWLYRLIKEPKRWQRIFRAVIIFPLVVIKNIFAR